ncbi:MAG TPA: plastocyanin/azurin family copper-binding protein [Candidatus Limnocylindria bacterium]|nr:plastocyanin/azurin family copper-binding protein [Candidatus Limnocylindria bacterium]
MAHRGLWLISICAIVVLGAGLAFYALSGAQTRPPADGPETPDRLVSGIHVTAWAADVSLAVAGAPADFGMEEDVRWVNIRVVAEVRIELRLESAHDLVLERPPYLCLVGPFWNPLDAGLSDRCWGDPDLAAVVAAQLPTDELGRPMLPGGRPVGVSATIGRGGGRCDYSPGEWSLEMAVEPVIDGSPVGRLDLEDIPVYVPFENRVVDGAPATLEILPADDTRICSYPAAVYLRQGEPPVQSPSGSPPASSPPGSPGPSSVASPRCGLTPAATADATMQISGFQFGDEISIGPGGVVAFFNTDSVTHTVTEGIGDTLAVDACIDDRIASGATLVVTFREPGDYDITCTLHAAMQTAIHVE